MSDEIIKKEKDPRYRKAIITKNLDTNQVSYKFTGFGVPVDVDTLWGFIDNECNAEVIKRRLVSAQRQPQNKEVEVKEDAKTEQE